MISSSIRNAVTLSEIYPKVFSESIAAVQGGSATDKPLGHGKLSAFKKNTNCQILAVAMQRCTRNIFIP